MRTTNNTSGHNTPRKSGRDQGLETLRKAYSLRTATQLQALDYCKRNNIQVPFWAVQDSFPAVTETDLIRVLTHCCEIRILKPAEDLTPKERKILAMLAKIPDPQN